MAHSNAPHDSEDISEHQEGEQGEVKHQDLILPPSLFIHEEELRAPYANEMLLLSFEGHHKKFEVEYEPEGKTPSYKPPLSSVNIKPGGLRGFFKRLWNRLLNRQ